MKRKVYQGCSGSSENELRAQLDDARIYRSARNPAESGRSHVGYCRQRKVRLIKLRMIKQVEELGANLQVHAFGDRGVLLERRIEIELAGTKHEARPGVPEPSGAGHTAVSRGAQVLRGLGWALAGGVEPLSGRRYRRRIAERAGIKVGVGGVRPAQPAGDAAGGANVGVSHAGTQFGTAESALGGVGAEAVSRASNAVDDGHRGAVLNGGHAGNIPTVEQLAHRSVMLAERQIPTVVDDEALRPIEVGRSDLLRQSARIVAVRGIQQRIGERLAPGIRPLHREPVR